MAAGNPITEAERARIVELIRAGRSRNDIAREVGRAAGSVTKIARDHGLEFDRSATQAATAAVKVDNASRRERLIAAMYDNAERLNQQMFEPAIERKAMVVADGNGTGSHVETVTVRLPQPTFGDKRNIAVATKVLVDGARVLEQVSDSGQEAAKGMLGRLVDGIRAEVAS